MSNDKRTILHKPLSEFEPKQIQWFPAEKLKIPRGKLTLFVGDPGDGKSFLLLKIIAETSISPGCRFVILSEDDPSDTTRPRIEVMGGKVERVEMITGVKTNIGKEESFYLTTDLDAFEELIKQTNPDLVLMDPLVSYTNPKTNTFKGAEVRAFLNLVVRLGEKYGFALVGVVHLNKADTKAIYKITDSTQYAAIAKSIYIVGRNPEGDVYDRVVCHLKTNISRPSKSYTFRIQSDPNDENRAGLEWGGESTLTANDLVQSFNGGSASQKPSKLSGCIEFTKGMLTRGPVPVSEWQAECEKAGYSIATQKRARDALNLLSIPPDKSGPGSVYMLALPNDERPTTTPEVVAHLPESVDGQGKSLGGAENFQKTDEPPLVNEPPLAESGGSSFKGQQGESPARAVPLLRRLN